MTIHVTQKHIDDGKRQKCYECAVALAFHEAGYPEAHVGPNTVFLGKGLGRVNLPENAKHLMYLIDLGTPVSPFSFEIEVPEL